MAEVTKRDERRAAKFNAKEAEAAPLFAHMGIAKTVTPEDVAARRERNVSDAEAHLARREQWTAAKMEEMRGRILAKVSATDLEEYLLQVKAGTPDGMPLFMALLGGMERAERGEPLYTPPDFAFSQQQRTWVDPDLCYDLLRRRPTGFFVHELEGCLQATILDIAAALEVLRGQSRAAVKQGGGWVAL